MSRHGENRFINCTIGAEPFLVTPRMPSSSISNFEIHMFPGSDSLCRRIFTVKAILRFFRSYCSLVTIVSQPLKQGSLRLPPFRRPWNPSWGKCWFSVKKIFEGHCFLSTTLIFDFPRRQAQSRWLDIVVVTSACQMNNLRVETHGKWILYLLTIIAECVEPLNRNKNHVKLQFFFVKTLKCRRA